MTEPTLCCEVCHEPRDSCECQKPTTTGVVVQIEDWRRTVSDLAQARSKITTLENTVLRLTQDLQAAREARAAAVAAVDPLSTALGAAVRDLVSDWFRRSTIP